MISLSCVSTEKKSRYYLNSGLNFIHKIKKKKKKPKAQPLFVYVLNTIITMLLFFSLLFLLFTMTIVNMCVIMRWINQEVMAVESPAAQMLNAASFVRNWSEISKEINWHEAKFKFDIPTRVWLGATEHQAGRTPVRQRKLQRSSWEWWTGTSSNCVSGAQRSRGAVLGSASASHRSTERTHTHTHTCA